MPLSKLSEHDLTQACEARLRILELWLRRLIIDRIQLKYSADILSAKNQNGDFIVKKDLRASVSKRMAERPGRYNRPVDALLLDDLVAVICKPDTYATCFKDALSTAFPWGVDEARTFLGRLSRPRNLLAHANPISIRDVEQVLCYSGDVISSLKGFYSMSGQADQYNAPRIVRLWDSFGNVVNAPAEPVFGFGARS